MTVSLSARRGQSGGAAGHLGDDLVPDDLDLGIGEEPLLEELRGPELVPPMDHVHLFGVAREVGRLLDGGVAAAHDGDGLALEEGPVAHGAVGDPLPRVLEFSGDAELGGRAAGGEDDRGGLEDRAGAAGHLEEPVLPLRHRLHVFLADVGAELLGVLGHEAGQLVALHGGEAGVVLDEVGVEELAARGAPLEDDGVQHAAAGVHAGAEAGGAGADDDQVVGRTGHGRTGKGVVGVGVRGGAPGHKYRTMGGSGGRGASTLTPSPAARTLGRSVQPSLSRKARHASRRLSSPPCSSWPPAHPPATRSPSRCPLRPRNWGR